MTMNLADGSEVRTGHILGPGAIFVYGLSLDPTEENLFLYGNQKMSVPSTSTSYGNAFFMKIRISDFTMLLDIYDYNPNVASDSYMSNVVDNGRYMVAYPSHGKSSTSTTVSYPMTFLVY